MVLAGPRRLLAVLFTALFVNAVCFRAVSASVTWPGKSGAPATLSAPVKAPPVGQTVPARKLRRRRHHAGHFAIPQQRVAALSQTTFVHRSFGDQDPARSRAPAALDHPPA